MTELPLVILSLCMIVMTWSVMATAFELRCLLRRLNTLLPDAEQVMKDVKQSLIHLRRVMTRTDHVSKQVEGIAVKACETVSGVVEQMVALKERAEHSVGRWFGANGHGTRLVSRSRRSRNH